MKLAANLSLMFTEHPFLDRFAAAADAGFEAVEYLFPYDHPAERIAEALRANALTQALFNLPAGDWAAGDRGLAAIPARAAEFRSSIGRALDYAEATGATRLHMMAGIADPADARARACYHDSLDLAAERLGERGVVTLIEPINGRDMPGYFLRDFGAAAALVAPRRPRVALQYDIYHRQILHGDVLRGLEDLLPLIGHVQIASVPARQEPGSGELDDLRVLRHLRRLGYGGFVGCEYRPAAGTVAGLGWIDGLRGD